MSRGDGVRRRGSLLGPIVVAMLAVGQSSTMVARATPPAADALVSPSADEASLEPDVTIATADEPEGAVLNGDPSEGFCGPILDVGVRGDDVSNGVTNTVECEEPTRPGPEGPTVSVLEEAAPPDLLVSKTSDAAGILHEGDDFLYTITVTNVGEEEARGVKLVDVMPPGALHVGVPPFPAFAGRACTVTSSVPSGGGTPYAEVRCGPVRLGPGGSASVTVKVIVSGDVCGPVANVVDVEGANEPPENVGPDNHAEASDEIACAPRIRLRKGGPSVAHVGDTIRYLFRARNNGNVDLFDVELADPTCDASPVVHHDTGRDDVLAAGEEWIFACAHTITAGDGDPVSSRATVSGDHEGGTVKDSDVHHVNVIHPRIDLETTASPTSGPAGTPIVYTYAITNTGDATLFHISVDDMTGRVGEIAALRDGQTVNLTRETTLGSSAITNVATAAGSDVIGAPVSDVDDATVTPAAGSAGDHRATPFTGSDTETLARWIVILTALGAALLAPSRKRSDTSIGR